MEIRTTDISWRFSRRRVHWLIILVILPLSSFAAKRNTPLTGPQLFALREPAAVRGKYAAIGQVLPLIDDVGFLFRCGGECNDFNFRNLIANVAKALGSSTIRLVEIKIAVGTLAWQKWAGRYCPAFPLIKI